MKAKSKKVKQPRQHAKLWVLEEPFRQKETTAAKTIDFLLSCSEMKDVRKDALKETEMFIRAGTKNYSRKSDAFLNSFSWIMNNPQYCQKVLLHAVRAMAALQDKNNVRFRMK